MLGPIRYLPAMQVGDARSRPQPAELFSDECAERHEEQRDER